MAYQSLMTAGFGVLALMSATRSLVRVTVVVTRQRVRTPNFAPPNTAYLPLAACACGGGGRRAPTAARICGASMSMPMNPSSTPISTAPPSLTIRPSFAWWLSSVRCSASSCGVPWRSGDFSLALTSLHTWNLCTGTIWGIETSCRIRLAVFGDAAAGDRQRQLGDPDFHLVRVIEAQQSERVGRHGEIPAGPAVAVHFAAGPLTHAVTASTAPCTPT